MISLKTSPVEGSKCINKSTQDTDERISRINRLDKEIKLFNFNESIMVLFERDKPCSTQTSTKPVQPGAEKAAFKPNKNVFVCANCCTRECCKVSKTALPSSLLPNNRCLGGCINYDNSCQGPPVNIPLCQRTPLKRPPFTPVPPPLAPITGPCGICGPGSDCLQKPRHSTSTHTCDTRNTSSDPESCCRPKLVSKSCGGQSPCSAVPCKKPPGVAPPCSKTDGSQPPCGIPLYYRPCCLPCGSCKSPVCKKAVSQCIPPECGTGRCTKCGGAGGPCCMAKCTKANCFKIITIKSPPPEIKEKIIVPTVPSRYSKPLMALSCHHIPRCCTCCGPCRALPCLAGARLQAPCDGGPCFHNPPCPRS